MSRASWAETFARLTDTAATITVPTSAIADLRAAHAHGPIAGDEAVAAFLATIDKDRT